MKVLVILFIFYSSSAVNMNFDYWSFTSYAYLVKPIYIFKVDSEITELGGKLDNSIRNIPIKVHKSMLSSSSVYYYFEVQEVLYGEEKRIFHLKFDYKEEVPSCDLNNAYDDHNDKQFWEGDEGRSILTNWPKSHSISTCFNIGDQYLIIANKHLGLKQYEVIRSSDDKWLKFVRDKMIATKILLDE